MINCHSKTTLMEWNFLKRSEPWQEAAGDFLCALLFATQQSCTACPQLLLCIFVCKKGEKMDQTYMKEKPIVPLVISMAIPMTISMLVNSLYNIIDSYYVARISEQAMTALSLVYPAQNLLTAVTVGFGIGTNAMIAYSLGAGLPKQADTAATLGLLGNILHGLLISVLCIFGMSAFVGHFTEDAEIVALGTQYARIVFLFGTANAAAISYEKMFQSIGRMKVSMVSMLVGCIVNIVLDPVMIFGFGPVPSMGIAGAAWATGIGQLVSLLIYLFVYDRDLPTMPVRISLRRMHQTGPVLRRIYSVGIPAALNLALSSVMITVLNGILAVYSASYVLVLGAYYKLQTFIYLTANGIVQGMRPICSYNYGAGELKRLKGIFRTGLLMVTAVMVIGTVFCFVIPNRLIGIFASNKETIALGRNALLIIARGFVISGISVTISGVLEGLGKGAESLAISLVRYIAVLLPLSFLLSAMIGADGVWHAFWITEIIAALLSLLLFRRIIKRIERELSR